MAWQGTTVSISGCEMTTVSLASGTQTVCTQPCLLLGVYVNTALSAHTCGIKDGTTAKLTLPASTTAGTNMNCHGSKFDEKLVVEPNASGTGTIVLFWKTV